MSVVYTQINGQTVLFLSIQFNMTYVCTQYEYQKVLLDP